MHSATTIPSGKPLKYWTHGNSLSHLGLVSIATVTLALVNISPHAITSHGYDNLPSLLG